MDINMTISSSSFIHKTYTEEQALLDLLYQSMQDSAREARLSLGRPSSHATREEALRQVAMLKAAKEAAQQIGR
jgi:hypothetical protein